MTAEQLEELLALIGGPDDHLHFGAVEKLKEISTSLARRVIAAEKLVEAGSKLASAAEYGFVTETHISDWDKAEKAYREASK